ncbi:SDR family oxidoreductase [Candidatus Woesearchaeota archaeon]|nr:SDR family oxidoreductase [Candidatus Woesearchaeota archaeon]
MADKQKRAIVTGGAGFIGSHMTELLLSREYKVISIDDLSNGQQENIDIFTDNKNYEFLKIDLSQKFDDSLFKGTTYVFHMAALADIVPSIQKPLKYHNANVNGTINVLEACRRHRVKKLIYSASSSCYGIPDIYPTSENAEMRPQYPYAFTKLIAEQYVLFWHKLYKLPVVSLRYFNVYGTRARTNNTYGAVFKVFLSQKLHNKPLTVVGDGRQTRDFAYVTDVAKATLIAAESDIVGEVINIGTGAPKSVNYLAKLIGGKTIRIPKRPGEPESTHADIKKAKNLLKWMPEVTFEEGVQIMLNNIGYWKNAPLWDKKSIKSATRTWFKYLSKQGGKKSKADYLIQY